MQHLVGSDILQSSLSYHTHTHFILPNLSLEGVSHCGIKSARNREQGEEGRTYEKRTFQDDSFFFVSGFWKPVVVKLVSICFGCLARTCHACSLEDVSVLQGTHRCLKCKCSLVACCQRVAHGTPGRLAHDAPTFGADSPAGATTVSVFAWRPRGARRQSPPHAAWPVALVTRSDVELTLPR